MKRRLREIADVINARVIGNDQIEISGIASIATAKAGDLVFVEDEKHWQSALESQAASVIAGSFAGSVKTSKVLLLCAHPRLAFAHAAAMLQTPEKRTPGIHATAIFLSSAAIADSAVVDPWTFVGENAQIGARSWIGAGSVIGSGVVIGDDCKIHPRVSIYPGTRIGDHVIVHAGAVLGSDGFGYVTDGASGRHEKFPQVGQLDIEDDVEIGANTTIDRGALETTRIGRGTKIDNLVHIGHNCQFGENVMIAAQAGFSGSITIENNVVIGGQVGMGEHAHIGEGVMLGGQAGVLPKKILRGKGVVFWGTPAKPVREYLKQLAALGKLRR